MIVDADKWIWWLLLPLLGWLLVRQVRYTLRQYESVRWPVTDATIQKGGQGLVPIGGGRGQGKPACFIGYTFCVGGSTYTGLFALYGRRDEVERVHQGLSSGSIRIRYNPANPTISYLNELNDPRFGGLVPTQNPEHLAQAPSFDLQDVMGN